ncbi:hypothetical protein ACU610_15800 [Geodermatophilus sp. URMC 61]|uniref:hypothetical protein n=1 Tax=Geodermatophilus sp. URMC 61 TaxID=3423411 RepID=UPI00406BFEE2
MTREVGCAGVIDHRAVWLAILGVVAVRRHRPGGRTGPAIRTRHTPPQHPTEREAETMMETDARVTREAVDRVPGPCGRIAGPVAVAVAAGLTLSAGLNHDIRYVLGVQRVSSAPVAETFSHRPLLYRWSVSALDHLAGALGDSRAIDEVVFRAGALLLCLAAGWLLWVGLRRVVVPAAGLTALVVTASLALAGPWIVLQPEWVAAVVVVGAVGLALRWSDGWLGPLAAGAGLALAGWLKLVTFATVGIGLLALHLLLPVLARRTAAATVLWALAWLSVQVVVFPVEVQWLRELSTLNRNSPLSAGIDLGDGYALLHAVLNSALMVPALTVLPAVVVVLWRRWSWRGPAALLAAGALSLAPLLVQGQWFLYHLAALSPVAAVALVAAVACCERRYAHVIGPGLLAAALWGGLTLSLPVDWRLSHGTLAASGAVLIATATAVAVARDYRLPRWRGGLGPGPRLHTSGSLALICAASFGVATLPTAGYSFDQGHADLTITEARQIADDRARQATAVHEAFGSGRTTYLAFGDIAYFLGDPATCGHPAATWLQRSISTPAVRETASYRDALDCLRAPSSRLVVQTTWFDLAAAPPEVQRLVAEQFDCSSGVAVDDLLVCARRG